MSDLFATKRKFYTMPYAKAGDCPINVRAFNKETGDEILDVVECNVREGWLIRCLRNSDGSFMIRDNEIYHETIHGMFEIRIYPA